MADNPEPPLHFATLAREVLNHRRFKAQVEARMAIFERLKGWYNPHRRHLALGSLSPVNYEGKLTGEPVAIWTSPGKEDSSEPHFEALSKASGLTPPRWP